MGYNKLMIPLFPRIIWINKLHDLMKRFSLTKGAIRKIRFLVIIATITRKKNALSKT